MLLKLLLTIDLFLFKNRKGYLCFILLGLTVYASSQQYLLREFPDGPAQPYVYTIIQDNNGYLWIGTGNGLSRYDGFNFKSYTTHDSLADNFITSSFKNGNEIWFGHMNGKVTLYNGKTFIPIAASNQKLSITDIEKDPNGNIWASTYSNGLVQINLNAGHEQNQSINHQITILSFLFIAKNEILVASVDGLNHCRIRKTGEIEVIRRFKEIPYAKVSDIIKMRNGSGYYVASENDGIFQIKIKDKKFKIIPIAPKANFKHYGVQSILEDSKSNLWINTFGNGLIKINSSASGQFNKVTYFNKLTGFSTNNVKTTYEDREGNIWSGNYGTGLTQMTNKAFSFYTLNHVLYGTAVYSIFVYNNIIWLGTDKGLLKINQSTNKIMSFYSSGHGLPNDKIQALYSNQDKELWVGTEKSGVYRMMIDKEKFLPCKFGIGMLENSITSITGKNNQLWIGTKKGVCNLNLTSGKIHWYTIEKGGLPHNNVNHLYIDTKDRLWVSTIGNTLAFIQDGKVGKIMIKSEKGVLSFGSIVEDHDSTIWVGSLGGGIFRIASDSIANITSKEGLFSDYCNSLIADNYNNIWIAHRGGLSKIRTTDLLVKPLQQYIGINNNCEFSKNAVFKDSKNRLCFGSGEGLLFYDPALENPLILPPVLNITSLKVNNVDVDYTDKLILSPGTYKIKIEFLGINLSEPANVIYKYQLLGYDPSPENTKTRSVIYSNLKEGKYTFTLWASTSDGVVTNKPLNISIIIKTSVWKQWWFYCIVFIAMVAIVTIYIKRREYKYRKEKLILEKKVRKRTNQLARKNALLKEQKTQIKIQNNKLKKYQDHLEQLVDERTKELLKAKNKAEESDRLKSAFLQNMSHEIRTPMNGILGFSSLLKEPDLTIEDKTKFIDIIDKSGQRLLNTINDIIEISKIESGQLNVNYTEVNLIEVLEYQLRFFEKPAKEKKLNLKLSVQIPDNSTVIETDKDIFENIFTNLINNAVKFTYEGTIEFGCFLEKDLITFYVKDTGVGIPADRLEAIFDRFVQADMNITRPYEGSGLGLSIVKEYIKLLNGKIWVESEIDKGSSFFFSFPFKPVKAQTIRLPEKTEPAIIMDKTLTILIAEDDDTSYQYIESILKKLNLNLLRATNGNEAIKQLKKNADISLVLMDIKMPELNGYDTTQKIRQFNKTIPIIAQTAYAMANDKEKAIAAGCNDYITKPVNSYELIRIIKKYS